MIQIWKDKDFVTVQDTEEHAKEYCKEHNIENAQIIKVMD